MGFLYLNQAVARINNEHTQKFFDTRRMFWDMEIIC